MFKTFCITIDDSVVCVCIDTKVSMLACVCVPLKFYVSRSTDLNYRVLLVVNPTLSYRLHWTLWNIRTSIYWRSLALLPAYSELLVLILLLSILVSLILISLTSRFAI